MNINMKILVIFLTLICSLKLEAQQLLTVEQAVAAALQNNYDIRLLRNDSAVYALNNSYARAVLMPVWVRESS